MTETIRHAGGAVDDALRCVDCGHAPECDCTHTCVLPHEREYDDAFATWRDAQCHANPHEVRPCQICYSYLSAVAEFEKTGALLATFATVQTARAAIIRSAPVDVIGVEAECVECGQGFNPTNDADLIHYMTSDQAGEHYCGGRGQIVGWWGQPR